MIANAGTIGLDWRYLSLSSYFEALEAFNSVQSGERAPSQPTEGLKAFIKAHSGGGNDAGLPPSKSGS
jgi:hypothetical protein